MGLQGLLQYSPSAGSASPVLGRLVCKGGLEQDSLFTSRRTNQSLFAVLAQRLFCPGTNRLFCRAVLTRGWLRFFLYGAGWSAKADGGALR